LSTFARKECARDRSLGVRVSEKRAVLKDSVCCKAEESPAVAPKGEYAIERGRQAIGLCCCATQNRFTLSFDAFLQHLNEGRIALVGK
jgi:hypothetical protein